MFGIWGYEQAAEITYYGLHALQHRGQDGAGLITTNGEQFAYHRDQGLVNDVFQRADFKKLAGHAAIGQDRKSTRLNSSHVAISYAVFCLKKKRDKKIQEVNRNKGH